MLNTLMGNKIYTIGNFLSMDECYELISFSEKNGYQEAPITTRDGARMRKDVRNNSRVMVDDVLLAERLWQKMSSIFPFSLVSVQPIGLNERFRYYRYGVGERFNWHYDGSFVRNEDEQSCVTFMIYLNDDFAGGETVFRFLSPEKEMIHVAPKKGMALLFDHQLMHCGMPVVSGTKYVLRSDVMFSKKN